jgi:hypothetical protein
MQSLKRYLLGAGVVAVLLHAVVAQTSADVARVQGLLSAARAALGGEEKLKSVQSLAATGKFRRVMVMQVQSSGDGGGHKADEAPPQMTGEFELAFALPDRFIRTRDMDLPMGGSVTEVLALDGTQAWSDIQNNSGGGGGIFIRRPPAGTTPPPGAQTAEQRVRAELTRYLLALLLNAPSDPSVEWSYAGEAEAEDGRADVLDCKGANGFNARLFLDKDTHRPLMLTYRSTEPVMRMMTRTLGPNDPPPAKGGQAPPDLPAPEMRESEIAVRFADYRTEDGITWPHQFTFARDGEVNEEWEIKSYKVNPQFKADKFKKKGN